MGNWDEGLKVYLETMSYNNGAEWYYVLGRCSSNIFLLVIGHFQINVPHRK